MFSLTTIYIPEYIYYIYISKDFIKYNKGASIYYNILFINYKRT